MAAELQLKAYSELINARLSELIPPANARPTELFQAMRHAALAPGKRLRPALCLASCEAAGGRAEDALNAACAIEMVHAFSLVHDDLPALDNDDLRRGRPTCHVVFGEAVAILAGDALFAHAFQTLVRPAVGSPLPVTAAARCVGILASSVGVDGVVAGETADILAEGKPTDVETLVFIHAKKTGALIAGSCAIGAAIASEDPAIEAHLSAYGEEIGLAFQIADDILNETSTAEQLGKAAGSDRERGKATYPALFGLEASRTKAHEAVDRSLAHLLALPGSTDFLRDLARYTVERLH